MQGTRPTPSPTHKRVTRESDIPIWNVKRIMRSPHQMVEGKEEAMEIADSLPLNGTEDLMCGESAMEFVKPKSEHTKFGLAFEGDWGRRTTELTFDRRNQSQSFAPTQFQPLSSSTPCSFASPSISPTPFFPPLYTPMASPIHSPPPFRSPPSATQPPPLPSNSSFIFTSSSFESGLPSPSSPSSSFSSSRSHSISPTLTPSSSSSSSPLSLSPASSPDGLDLSFEDDDVSALSDQFNKMLQMKEVPVLFKERGDKFEFLSRCAF